MKNIFQNRIKTIRLGGVLQSTIFRLTVLAAFLLVVLFKVALPLFVSTASVKANMEDALSSWTGGLASISNDPTISFWPRPHLTLHDVTIVSVGDNPQTMAKAQAITADFDVLAALRGTPVFTDFHLLAPAFRIERLADGTLNWRKAGWMADAMDGEPDQKPVLAQGTPIGDITIENGILDIADQPTGTDYRITDITGTIAWPTPSERIRANLSAVIKGESVKWSFVCDDPLSFFSGLRTPISTALTSAPVNFAFDGAGSLSASAFFSGQSSFSAPSVSALLRWVGMDIGQAAAVDAISLDAAMTVGRQALKLDNLTLALNGGNATGVLDITRPDGHLPRIGGTLAFDSLDLNTLFRALAPLPAASDGIARTVNTRFMEWLRLDLRLSAQQAKLGPIMLTDLAAGAMVRDGRASFDIGDSGYAGGSLSGRIAIAEQWINGGGELALALKGADLESLASQLALEGPLPLGRGDLSLDLSTDKPMWAMTASDLSGRVRLAVNDGKLVNFNAADFETLVARDAFFNLSEVTAGSFAFSTADIEATIKDGVAELTRADIVGQQQTLTLAGRIPYRTGSLALAGVLKAAKPQPEAAPLRFFVGGSWPNPVISPLSVLIRP
ncbi:AsmA family protein [Pararhizobium antarcticum]|nr:AsmA family protein [Pararhizobium antarcticum]